MKLVPIHVSDQEKSKIRSVLELARRGFNYLACLDLRPRTKDTDLIELIIGYFKEDSPSRRMAAQLALSMRRRDGVGIKPAFKRLGANTGPVALAASAGVILGRQAVVMNTVYLDIAPYLTDHDDVKSYVFELKDEVASVALELAPKKDKKGSLVRKYERKLKHTGSMGHLQSQQKKRAKK